MDYCQVYDTLYANGYRGGRKFTGMVWAKIVNLLCKFDTVLDVGCARGDGCLYFKSQRKNPQGCDVATAAVQATKKLGFQAEVASATKLPYADRTFDMVFSSDVVEHIEEDDIPHAVGEMLRVSKEWVALQIATRKTKHASQALVGIPNLHVTIWDRDQWLQYFQQRQDVRIAYYAWNKNHVMLLLRRNDA